MFLVCIAFAFVYLVFADRNPHLITQHTVIKATKWGEEMIILPDNTSNTINDPNYTEQDLLAKLKWIDKQNSQSGWTESSLLILSWTSLTYNELESLKKLDIRPKYILKGKNDIYFVNLGRGEIELSFRVSKYNGSIKTLTDVSEIKKNGFDFLIMNYLNIPTWKEQLVVFTTKQNSDNWLVQSTTTAYYNNKSYISQTLNSGY